ncbi:type II secretion system F family protein [Catenulispora pinisilvae]|uniref:type II secretion system F family protein n=1 Tax=Catenulispora pinisilvae TaxID=2705253 RepID=UPI0018910E71|nr:type II secretion system F family protein [Catenulispora pinisilvae]
MTPGVLTSVLCGIGVAAGITLMLRGLIGVPADAEPKGPGVEELLERLKAPGTTRRVLISIAAAVAAAAFTGWPVAAAIAALAAWALPGMFGKDRAAVGEQARVEAIATFTEALRDTLGAAAGLEQSILAAATSAPAPIRAEVHALAANLKTGMRLDQALRVFAADLGDATGDLVVAALVLASKQQARNLGEVLTELADYARQQAAAQMRITADRQRTRSSVRIIVVFVLGIAGVLMAMDSSYMAPFGSSAGQVVLALVAGIFAVSFWWLHKIAAPKKPTRFLTRLQAHPVEEGLQR